MAWTGLLWWHHGLARCQVLGEAQPEDQPLALIEDGQRGVQGDSALDQLEPLVLDSDPNGSLGVILNRPSEVPVGEVLTVRWDGTFVH